MKLRHFQPALRGSDFYPPVGQSPTEHASPRWTHVSTAIWALALHVDHEPFRWSNAIMDPLSTEFLKIGPSTTTKNSIFERAESDELRDNLRAANVVFVSTAGHGTATTSFPSGTRELFRFMRQAAEPTLRIEANVSDDDYRELTLHSDEWRLPLMLLADPAASEFAINLISNYLSQRLRQLLTGRTVKVSSELVIERKGGSIRLKYEGPADTFKEIVLAAVRQLDEPDPKS